MRIHFFFLYIITESWAVIRVAKDEKLTNRIISPSTSTSVKHPNAIPNVQGSNGEFKNAENVNGGDKSLVLNSFYKDARSQNESSSIDLGSPEILPQLYSPALKNQETKAGSKITQEISKVYQVGSDSIKIISSSESPFFQEILMVKFRKPKKKSRIVESNENSNENDNYSTENKSKNDEALEEISKDISTKTIEGTESQENSTDATIAKERDDGSEELPEPEALRQSFNNGPIYTEKSSVKKELGYLKFQKKKLKTSLDKTKELLDPNAIYRYYNYPKRYLPSSNSNDYPRRNIRFRNSPPRRNPTSKFYRTPYVINSKNLKRKNYYNLNPRFPSVPSASLRSEVYFPPGKQSHLPLVPNPSGAISAPLIGEEPEETFGFMFFDPEPYEDDSHHEGTDTNDFNHEAYEAVEKKKRRKQHPDTPPPYYNNNKESNKYYDIDSEDEPEETEEEYNHKKSKQYENPRNNYQRYHPSRYSQRDREGSEKNHEKNPLSHYPRRDYYNNQPQSNRPHYFNPGYHHHHHELPPSNYNNYSPRVKGPKAKSSNPLNYYYNYDDGPQDDGDRGRKEQVYNKYKYSQGSLKESKGDTDGKGSTSSETIIEILTGNGEEGEVRIREGPEKTPPKEQDRGESRRKSHVHGSQTTTTESVPLRLKIHFYEDEPGIDESLFDFKEAESSLVPSISKLYGNRNSGNYPPPGFYEDTESKHFHIFPAMTATGQQKTYKIFYNL